MPYILNKTNGNKITIVDDASLDVTTDLVFVGRNYAGYGEIVNENFLKLLENFSNTTAPEKPILGQIWFNSSSDIKRLNVYDGKQFKSVANIFVSRTNPSLPLTGDLWWDSENDQLKVYTGSDYRIIGPQESTKASWQIGEEILPSTLKTPVIKGKIGSNTIAVLSKEDFLPSVDSSLQNIFPIIKPGLTLAGADAITGSSKEAGNYFWGTAADCLVASTSTAVLVTETSTNQTFYIPFVDKLNGGSEVFTDAGISYNPSTNILSTIASSARYADLAERYEADQSYEPGMVLVIGGSKEVTTTDIEGNTSVAGIVSKNPAYMMNSDSGSDQTHPYIALKGRVPCKVSGVVSKGDLLVTSNIPGHASKYIFGKHDPNAVLAKALQDNDKETGLIEVFVA